MKFCDDCGAVLHPDMLSGTLIFVCPRCNVKYPSDASDTLIFSQNFKKDETLKFETFIRSAGEDNTNYITERNCVKCKSKYAKMIRVGEKLAPNYICVECQNLT